MAFRIAAGGSGGRLVLTLNFLLALLVPQWSALLLPYLPSLLQESSAFYRIELVAWKGGPNDVLLVTITSTVHGLPHNFVYEVSSLS